MTHTGMRSPEEVISRMTDDDLFGGQQSRSRPQSVGGSRPSSRGTPKVQTTILAQLRATPVRKRSSSSSSSHARSAVGLLRPSSQQSLRSQKSERVERFHFMRQRKWLEGHNKQWCLSFTEQETMDFRRFFKALAKGENTIHLDTFEDLLICLDLAKSRKDIRAYTESLEENSIHELTFEDFLKAFENNLNFTTMHTLKLLLQDRYDTRDLEYPTFISERRRELIFSATGARGERAQAPTSSIVKAFADRFEDRCHNDFGHDGTTGNEDRINFLGELQRMWQVACVQRGLSRQNLSAEERARSVAGQRPPSPRTVINNIKKDFAPKPAGVRRCGPTILVEVDGL
mmetsp:Transcript_43747/g.69989  ORF Transcript_43747/g.69989 Transcript_43747/m.69989 type:complete len:344 (+) Transcript_43747:147-1178(+)